MLYDTNNIKKLFKKLGIPLSDEKLSKFKLQEGQLELEERGTSVHSPKNFLTKAEAKKLLEAFKKNGIKSMAILDKSGKAVSHIEDQRALDRPGADEDGYSFSCWEVDFFKIFNLSVSGNIKKATVTVVETSTTPQPTSSIAAEPSVVQNNEKLKKNYFGLYSQFFEMFKTERNYRKGLEITAEVLKNLRAKKATPLDETLILAYEGAIQKALTASKKMFEIVQQVKDSFPVELNTKWESLTKEIDELSESIPKEMNIQKKKDKNEQLTILKKQREELSEKIFEAIERDPEIFSKLTTSINEMEKNYPEYHAGFRDAKVLNTIISRNQKQFDLWKKFSLEMKETAGRTQGIFDYTKLPIQRSGQYELYLKDIAKQAKEIANIKKNSKKVADFEKANNSALEQVAKDGKAANVQQALDDIAVIHSDKMPRVASMKKFEEQLRDEINKIKSKKEMSPLDKSKLSDLIKQKEMLDDIVKRRKSLTVAKVIPEKKFRERTEAAIAAAIALENVYFFYSNTENKTIKDLKKINILVKNFQNKLGELTSEERKMLDALGQIEPLRDHKLINPLLNKAESSTNQFLQSIFHEHARGKKYADDIIKLWAPEQVMTALNHEKHLLIVRKDELLKEYHKIIQEFSIKMNVLDEKFHTLTQKIKDRVFTGNEQKKSVIDEIHAIQRDMNNLNRTVEAKQQALIAKETAFFGPIIADSLASHKAGIKSALEMAASQLIRIKTNSKARIKELEKEQQNIESNRILNLFHNLEDDVHKLQKRVNPILTLLETGAPNEIQAHLEKNSYSKDIKEMKQALIVRKSELEHTFKHVPDKLSKPVLKAIENTLGQINQIEKILEKRNKLEVPIQKFVEKYRNGVYFQEYKDVKKQPLDPKVFMAIQKVFQKHLDLSKEAKDSKAKNTIGSLRALQKDLSTLTVDNTRVSDIPAGKFICAKIDAELESLFSRTTTLERNEKPQKKAGRSAY